LYLNVKDNKMDIHICASNYYWSMCDFVNINGGEMKKDLFWKIMAILFYLWLCLFLWSESIVIPQGTFFKVNKLTGKVYDYSESSGKWGRF